MQKLNTKTREHRLDLSWQPRSLFFESRIWELRACFRVGFVLDSTSRRRYSAILINAPILMRPMMVILLTGVSCVGKSSIAKKLAEDVNFIFFDLDIEIEKYYGNTISRLKAEILTEYSWMLKGVVVLKKIVEENKEKEIVVAMPPSGLWDAYLRVVKKSKALAIVLTDTPENILDRVTYYDEDSKPIAKELNDRQKKFVSSEIKKDITYYRRSYRRAHFQVDISGLNIAQAADKLKELLRLEPPLKNPDPRALSIVPRGFSKPKLVYSNRRGAEYYLHVGRTKKGNHRYYFSMKNTGELATEVPEGYEIYEDQNDRLYLRRIQPRLTVDEETEIIEKEIR